jgi:hypothetical protein
MLIKKAKIETKFTVYKCVHGVIIFPGPCVFFINIIKDELFVTCVTQNYCLSSNPMRQST